MSSSKFERLEDGQVYEINLKEQYLKYACCDCGMVHSIQFKVSDNGETLYYRFDQEPKATGQLRRHEFGNLHKGVRGYKIEKEVKEDGSRINSSR